jgi:hypothetical protein
VLWGFSGMQQNSLAVFSAPLPFSNLREKVYVAPGSTLQQCVDAAIPTRYLNSEIDAVVMINGHIIPKHYWHLVRPKIGTVTNINIIPQGGGGGKKNPIATLLSIAVMIAAPYAATALLGPTLAATQVGIGALTYGGLLSGAIGVVGRLAISALAPPPKPSNSGLANVSNAAESPTQFIEGASNALNPYGVVPINLGTNRMFPLQAARAYTETMNDDQYVRQLFTHGYGEKMLTANLKIGETPISEFNDFEIEYRLNGDLHEGTTLFSNDINQDNYNILLQQVDGFTLRTTKTDVDAASVDVTFPQGLCWFNSQGARLANNVKMELQYSPAGLNDWSPAAESYTAFTGDSFVIPAATTTTTGETSSGSRRDFLVVDKYTGVISRLEGPGGYSGLADPVVGSTQVRIASITINTSYASGVYTTNAVLSDDRQPGLYGTVFEDDTSFVPSIVGLTATVTGGSIKFNELDITASQTEALRRSVMIQFPARGTYDIRIRRLTGDDPSDQSFDEVYLTAIRSITYESPVALQGINGIAVRIKATDQLNGALDQLNEVVSTVIEDYDAGTDTWIERATSNPASLYVYVLQCRANAKAQGDEKINFPDMQAWHTLCVEQGYSYNRVIDYDASVDDILRDIAAAGSASPAIVDGKRTVAIDCIKTDVVQIITPRNSWGYSGEIIYPDLPHAFRVQFRNADKGYAQDERIVYDDGYDESNATKFEVLELQSCTNSDLAFKTGRRHIASARLRPEIHTWMMDVENLVALRGDRVKLAHDVPIIGVGDGRIKTVTTDGNSPALVTGVTLDDTVTIPSVSSYYMRVRLSDGTFLYKELVTSVGSFTEFNFAVPFSIADTPEPGDLCYVVEAGGELDLLITRIDPQDDLTARITAINYDEAIFTAENTTIPPFVSNITTPLEFIRPSAPVLVDTPQTDETVMLRNSDGSYTTRAIISLQNVNEGDVSVNVKIRVSGTTIFTNANILEATPERVILTGLEDNTRYDIHIRYRRAGTVAFSLPLQLNSLLFVGAGGLPSDVTGFLINVSGETALLKCDPSPDIDFHHFKVKFSKVFSGATWATAQVLEEVLLENRLSTPFQGGTYLIKAVDIAGNESANATAIITYDPGIIANAVEVLTEHPTFAGVKDNVLLEASSIIMSDTAPGIGYYYFDNEVDLTDVFTAFVSATVVANGDFVNDLFDYDDLFALDDLFGSGLNDMFLMDDMFIVDDLFGIGNDAWAVQLQYRTTDEDPAGSPVTWTAWTDFVAGNIEFRGIQFRIALESLAENVSPRVTTLSVTIDMPDRIERGEDLTVLAAGTTITYTPEFKANPAVVITIQDGDAADEIIFTAKDSGGFTFRVYNTVAAGYVDRIYDYIASGYGRKS